MDPVFQRRAYGVIAQPRNRIRPALAALLSTVATSAECDDIERAFFSQGPALWRIWCDARKKKGL
jgi:hypothetical protein